MHVGKATAVPVRACSCQWRGDGMGQDRRVGKVQGTPEFRAIFFTTTMCDVVWASCARGETFNRFADFGL